MYATATPSEEHCAPPKRTPGVGLRKRLLLAISCSETIPAVVRPRHSPKDEDIDAAKGLAGDHIDRASERGGLRY